MFIRETLLLLSCMSLVATYACGEERLPDAPLQDTVTFKNGDVLTGTVLGTTSTTLDFTNPAVGQLSLKWGDLRDVRINHDVTITSGPNGANTQIFHGATVVAKQASIPGALELSIKKAGQTNLLVPDVQSIKGLPGPPPGWQIAKFKLNVALLAATTDQQTYGAELDLVRNWNPEEQGWPHQRTFLQLLPSYDEKRKNDKPGSASITQDYYGKLQDLFFITNDNFYASTVADVYRNNSLGLYFQQAYGGGLGFIFHDVELNVDLRFIGQHFYPPTHSTSLVGSQLSERYSFGLNFIRPGTVFNETAIFTPVFNQNRAWQLQGLSEVVIPITKKVGFSTSISDNYLENAPPTFHKNYFKTSFGIQYTPAKH